MITTKKSIARSLLIKFYLTSGYLAAFFLLSILIIIVAQMLYRWLGYSFPGSTDYAGYCMAASTFFGLAYTLNRNAHIRVNIMLNLTKGKAHQLLQVWCLSFAVFISAYFSFYAIRNVKLSRVIHDISQGQDATPLWIPQLSLAIGMLIFTIALLDHLILIVCNKEHTLGDGSYLDGEF